MINQIKEIINKNYNIKITNIEKNEESTDGNVYIVSNNKNKYVAKIYKDINHVKAMCQLHIYLNDNKSNIPKIITNKHKGTYTKYNDFYIILYSFLKGKSISEKWNNEEIYKQVAKEIRLLHDITSNNNTFNLKKVPFEIDNSITRCSVLHFDLTKGNIFYNKNKIEFIDFDDAKYGASVVDVAIAIALLFITKKNGLDIEGMKIFINEYYKNDEKSKNNEIKYIRDIGIKWVNYIIENNDFDTSTNESFQIKKQLIENEFEL